MHDWQNIKIESQRWPAKSLISGRSGTQYVAMVTQLAAHILEGIFLNLTAKNQAFLIQIGWDIFCHDTYTRS